MDKHVWFSVFVLLLAACSTQPSQPATVFPRPRPAVQPQAPRPPLVHPPREATIEVKHKVDDPALLQKRLCEARLKAEEQALDPVSHYELANVLFDLGQFEAALPEYDRVIVLAPDHATAHINRGLCLKRLGRVSEAIDEYRKALQIQPGEPTALQNLVVALEGEGQISESVEVLNELARVRGNDIPVLARLAHDLYLLGRYREAAGYFQYIIHLDPGLASDYYNLGLCHFQLADYDQALITWLTALAHDSRNESVNKGLAILYWKRGEHKQAWDIVLNCRAKGISLDNQFLANLQKDTPRNL